MTKMNDCLKYLYSLRRFGIKLGLDTIGELLSFLGNPQKNFKSIHIAGTNGKGSVSATIASILYNSGYKTGLYTSPHLIKFNERIQINDEPITDERVIALYEAVKQAPPLNRDLTFFEYTTAMAFYEFAMQKTEWSVIETGMGGRLDATNIVSPQVCIITNISLEHQQYLGNTIAEIASEKAGIIKPNCPVITGVDDEIAWDVISNVAKNNNAPIYRLGKDFKFSVKNNEFTYIGLRARLSNAHLNLMGKHQYLNAALSLAAIEILSISNPEQIRVEGQRIRTTLRDLKWPGRLEIIHEKPRVIVDGAHNLKAIQCLKEFLDETYILNDKRITLVLGILEDKPWKEILSTILPIANKVVLTKPKIERGIPADILNEFAKTIASDIKIIPDVGKALRYAIANTAPNDIVCVAGSLYVVGEAKAEITNCSDDIFLA